MFVLELLGIPTDRSQLCCTTDTLTITNILGIYTVGHKHIELEKERIKTALKCAANLSRKSDRKAAPLNSDHNLLKKGRKVIWDECIEGEAIRNKFGKKLQLYRTPEPKG